MLDMYKNQTANYAVNLRPSNYELSQLSGVYNTLHRDYQIPDIIILFRFHLKLKVLEEVIQVYNSSCLNKAVVSSIVLRQILGRDRRRTGCDFWLFGRTKETKTT